MIKINKIKLVIIILITVFINNTLNCQDNTKVYSVEDVPNTHLMDKNKYVTDPDNILPIEIRDSLDHKLYDLDYNNDLQTAIVILPAINTEASVFAADLLNLWKVGRAETDRGLVILLVYGGSSGNRDIFMTTGYGIEDELPDAFLKKVQTQHMMRYLKEGNYGEALIVAMDKISKNVEQDTLSVKDKNETSYLKWAAILWGFLGFFIFNSKRNNKNKALTSIDYNPLQNFNNFSKVKKGSILIGLLFLPFYIIYSLWFNKNVAKIKKESEYCPDCKNGKLKKVKSETVRTAENGKRGVIKHILTCPSCNKEFSANFYSTPVYNAIGDSFCDIGKTKSRVDYGDWILISTETSTSSRGGGWSSGSGGRGSWGGGSGGGGGAGSKF